MSAICDMICPEYEYCKPVYDEISRILGKDLEEIVVDDWRRPIVDSVLLSIHFYGMPTNADQLDTMLTILRLLGYPQVAEAFKQTVLKHYKDKLEQLKQMLEKAEEIVKELSTT